MRSDVIAADQARLCVPAGGAETGTGKPADPEADKAILMRSTGLSEYFKDAEGQLRPAFPEVL